MLISCGPGLPKRSRGRSRYSGYRVEARATLDHHQVERCRRQARQAELSRELGKGEFALSASDIGLTWRSLASTISTSTLSTLLGCAKVTSRGPGRNSSCSRRKDSSSELIGSARDLR